MPSTALQHLAQSVVRQEGITSKALGRSVHRVLFFRCNKKFEQKLEDTVSGTNRAYVKVDGHRLL
jgi:hypothetical protein